LIYYTATSSLILRDAGSDTQGQLNSEGSEISNVSFIKRSDTQGKGYDTITAVFRVTSKAETRGVREFKDFKTSIGLRKP
jgi:hypothetical protein